MSVIIRLQNLPWSANALDIRNYFRGLSIPEGGVHIVGGELGDAFIAFSTDEDARQAMMLDGGKIKEIQVKLLLSSRSEMHKVIEAARQTVPILSLAPTVTASSSAPAPAPVVPASLPTPVAHPTPPAITPFSSVLGSSGFSSFGIPGLGNPQEIPQPAVIEPPALLISPQSKTPEEEDNDDKSETRRNKDRRRSRSHSRSRDRDRKDRKRDRRDRSRSRERRRRDRSRSRERRDRKRDRKDRSRSRERSPRRSRDKRNMDRRSPQSSQERTTVDKANEGLLPPTHLSTFANTMKPAHNNGQPQMGMQANSVLLNGPMGQAKPQATQARFTDPALKEAFNKLQELGKKRNPNAFQGDQNSGGGRIIPGRGGNSNSRGGGNLRRDGRQSRFDDQPRDCCVAIRNAPNHTSYGDVRRFFPFMIDKHGIKMINDNMGRRTGSIFVRFCDPRSKQLALQKQPNELKGSLVIVESLDDEMYDSAVDSYLPFRDDNDEEDLSSNMDQDNRRPSFKFSVLKLGDLPNFVKEHDIVKAFSDFSLLSILLNDCRLTRTKTAFVQFAKPDDARKALERKESYLFGRRQPIITPVTDDEYENEKITNDKIESQNNRMINNEPTPEPAVPRDPRQRRLQNDSGPGSQPSNTQGQPPFFPPTGPFPQNFNAPFANPQFSAFPSGNMDPRTAAANWANRPPFPKKKEPARGPPAISQQIITLDGDDETLDCVLMKGLPREATDRTILDFLSDTGAVPARIHLMLDGNGRPSGDCFCEFRTSEEARLAASKHGSNLDGKRITVDLVMRSVVEEALEGPKTEPKRDLLGNAPLINSPIGNGPPATQFFDSPRENFSGRGAFRGRGSFQRSSGFDRGGFNRGGFDQSRGNYRGRGSWNDRGRGFDRGRGRGFGRGRGGFDGGRDRDNREQVRQEDDDPGLEDFGAPGCVVSMENVPFRATVDDILSFFGDFELTQDDVIRRYNERGQPTGDARVAFASPALAQRALASRNMNTIFERRVSLSLL